MEPSGTGRYRAVGGARRDGSDSSTSSPANRPDAARAAASTTIATPARNGSRRVAPPEQRYQRPLLDGRDVGPLLRLGVLRLHVRVVALIERRLVCDHVDRAVDHFFVVDSTRDQVVLPRYEQAPRSSGGSCAPGRASLRSATPFGWSVLPSNAIACPARRHARAGARPASCSASLTYALTRSSLLRSWSRTRSTQVVGAVLDAPSAAGRGCAGAARRSRRRPRTRASRSPGSAPPAGGRWPCAGAPLVRPHAARARHRAVRLDPQSRATSTVRASASRSGSP